MVIRPPLALAAGAVLVGLIGYGVAKASGDDLAGALEQRSEAALVEAGAGGVQARFTNGFGSPTRHPLLSGGEALDDDIRTKAARAVAGVPGVGGIKWSDGDARVQSGSAVFEPLHCQEDVDGLLRSRTIRFEEASSALVPASRLLLDEVADALRPCVGAIIAITGHTDASGSEADNLALSEDRARAVREELVRRGIPREGLRARGIGPREPVDGLAPNDPANRRIEFSVIRKKPVIPHPVDTPGPR